MKAHKYTLDQLYAMMREEKQDSTLQSTPGIPVTIIDTRGQREGSCEKEWLEDEIRQEPQDIIKARKINTEIKTSYVPLDMVKMPEEMLHLPKEMLISPEDI